MEKLKYNQAFHAPTELDKASNSDSIVAHSNITILSKPCVTLYFRGAHGTPYFQGRLRGSFADPQDLSALHISLSA